MCTTRIVPGLSRDKHWVSAQAVYIPCSPSNARQALGAGRGGAHRMSTVKPMSRTRTGGERGQCTSDVHCPTCGWLRAKARKSQPTCNVPGAAGSGCPARRFQLDVHHQTCGKPDRHPLGANAGSALPMCTIQRATGSGCRSRRCTLDAHRQRRAKTIGNPLGSNASSALRLCTAPRLLEV